MSSADPPASPLATPVPQIEAAAEPVLKDPSAEGFYVEALRELDSLGIPFLLAGTYALSAYTGITRPTKDLDIFCKAGDYPRILSHFKSLGYAIEVEDERWIGKVWKGGNFFDVIYNISTASIPITDEWFREVYEVEVYGTTV
ncbi:MAG TPA: hypothetical protein VEA41_02265, partial [Salinarimonas sp.]|nr:hypothetical protein [Salinarimonas sp.]